MHQIASVWGGTTSPSPRFICEMPQSRGIHYDLEIVYCSKEHIGIHLANNNDIIEKREEQGEASPEAGN